MTFKENWEKTNLHFQLEKLTIEKMLRQALPKLKTFSYEVISGGCANLNIKFNDADGFESGLLRVYLRDKDAAYREQKLATLINGLVPIPEVYFIGDLNAYRFAITEYKPGITLRELLLSGKLEGISPIMSETGLVLAKIQSYRFVHAGFFDKDLTIAETINQDFFTMFAKSCLDHPTATNQISKENISKIHSYFERYSFLFQDQSQNHLVHADYDPANILVHKCEGEWKISAILDWEFAFSGSFLCDVATMLRYAHHMPPEFEDAFLQGLQKGGVQLPENWRISLYMLNLLSLLDCLTRCPSDKRPNQSADICDLIAFIIRQLDKMS